MDPGVVIPRDALLVVEVAKVGGLSPFLQQVGVECESLGVVGGIVVDDTLGWNSQLDWHDCFCTEGHTEGGFAVGLRWSGSIRPEDLGEFLGPQALGVVDFLFEQLLDDFVDGLDLTICLWVCRGGIKKSSVVLASERTNVIVVELAAIVGDDGVGCAKVAVDVLSQEVLNFGGGDDCECLSLDPLGVVVDRHNNVLELPLCRG